MKYLFLLFSQHICFFCVSQTMDSTVVKNLAELNRRASYGTYEIIKNQELKNYKYEDILSYSTFVYNDYIKNSNERHYTGILLLIDDTMLSDIAEKSILERNEINSFDAYCLARTPNVEFIEKQKVLNLVNHITDPCFRKLLNTILLAKYVKPNELNLTDCDYLRIPKNPEMSDLLKMHSQYLKYCECNDD